MTETQKQFSAHIEPYNGELLLDEPLSRHCTFRIGGPGEIVYTPHDEKALIAALRFAAENDTKLHVLGNGSNVLIADEGLKGITLLLIGGLTELVDLGDGLIACGAGVPLKRLCMFALEHSLTGLEFAYGIPGSVGGALYMNAGAYGGEMKNVLASVRSVDRATGEVEETPLSELTYAYRNTSFMKNGRIITAGYFQLQPGDPEMIKAKMQELLGKRKASQPLEWPSAGSTFKRPPVGYAAAHIDECGLKGRSVGGAQVSEKHAGFVINTGGATFRDVTALMDVIRQEVFRQHGVTLEAEVEILRDAPEP
jgi:UDP-N-acetylmuramate dehydrogenase